MPFSKKSGSVAVFFEHLSHRHEVWIKSPGLWRMGTEQAISFGIGTRHKCSPGCRTDRLRNIKVHECASLLCQCLNIGSGIPRFGIWLKVGIPCIIQENKDDVGLITFSFLNNMV